MPEFVFAVICFALGVVIGSGFISLKLSRMNRLLKSEHKHVMALQNEISAMRAEKQELLLATPPKK